jgi:tetratricopeptide (TPR) repeat protein/CHAT domain-containing protein
MKKPAIILFIFIVASPIAAQNADYYYQRGLESLVNGDYNQAIRDFSYMVQLDPNNPGAYYARGVAYYWNDEAGQAIEDFTRAILLDPNNAIYYNDRGTAYIWIGKYDLAIEDYTQAILLEPNASNAYNNRGFAYYNKADYNSAIEDYTRAIRLDPNLAIAYNNRGNAYLEKSEYNLAIEDYTLAIRLDPNYAIAYNNRGNAYREKNEYNLAIEDYTHAIRLDPNYAIAYNNRGFAYYNKAEYDKAIEDYNQAIRLDPNYAIAYNNRGFAYHYKAEYDLAIEDYNRAILLDPNLAIAYNNRGNAYSFKGEYDLAIEDYTQAILLDPNYADAFNGRGVAYLDIGDYDLAIKDHAQAILLDQNHAMAYSNRGNGYNFKGEYDLAIKDYTQAILLDPNYAMAYNNRGLAYKLKDEYDLAIEDYTQAILLDLNHAMAYSNRGDAYNFKGEYDRAIEDCTQAILLNPNYAAAYMNRGIAYANIGKYDLAMDDYEKVLEAAENAANLNDIFMATMNFADAFYTDYPYLNLEEEDLLTEFRADLTMDGIARSVRRAEQARSNLGARGSAIMTQALYFYYMGLDLEANFGSPEKAFEYSESLRSRGFLDQVGTEAALRLPGIREDERERMRRLLGEIENRQNVLDAFRQRPPQTQEEERSFVSVGQTLSVLEAELAALDTEIGSRIPQYAELRNPVPASLAQARDWLAEDTAVLIYALWDDSIDFMPYTGIYALNFSRPTVNSYCLVLTKDSLTEVTLDHGFNYLQAINRLRINITRRNRIGTLESDRNALYNALVKPALAHIPAYIQNLIIVPDGTLAHLPFDILRENDNSPELGETYRLSLSPSISVSMLSARMAPQNLPILAFGGAWYDRDKTAAERGEQRSVVYGDEPNLVLWLDLPGTEEEVGRLEQRVPSTADIKVFRGSDVSEAQVKWLSDEGELAKYPILHFATHGYFKEEDLERAGIVLSEVSGLLDNGEDGYLTIPEIAVLNLNARMVLLSACETGLGVLRRGDGMVGMVRAFMLAGSEYLGVSLWEVNDEATLEFMTRLYGKVLNEGKTFKEAYYLVKDEFRNNNRWSHPNYWSAFVLYE